MSNNEELSKIMQVHNGDDWLLEQGVISDLSKNAIVIGVLASYPQVKNLEFKIDPYQKTLDMTVYISIWRLLFMTLFFRRNKFLNSLFDDISTYLKGNYQVRVSMERFKGD